MSNYISSSDLYTIRYYHVSNLFARRFLKDVFGSSRIMNMVLKNAKEHGPFKRDDLFSTVFTLGLSKVVHDFLVAKYPAEEVVDITKTVDKLHNLHPSIRVSVIDTEFNGVYPPISPNGRIRTVFYDERSFDDTPPIAVLNKERFYSVMERVVEKENLNELVKAHFQDGHFGKSSKWSHSLSLNSHPVDISIFHEGVKCFKFLDSARVEEIQGLFDSDEFLDNIAKYFELFGEFYSNYSKVDKAIAFYWDKGDMERLIHILPREFLPDFEAERREELRREEEQRRALLFRQPLSMESAAGALNGIFERAKATI